MSRERRIVRPYQGVDRFQAVLDDLRIQIGDREIHAGGLATTTSADFVSQPVHLVLGDDVDARDAVAADLVAACAEAGLTPDSLELIIVLRTPRLKLSTIAWRCSLGSITEAGPWIDLTSDGRPSPLLTPIGGCTIHLYVALREESERVVLAPWRKGTWIARSVHKIKTNINEVGFTPLELTDEIRDQHGIPSGTLRYAVVDDPLTEGGGAESILLYIDTDVLSELAANPKTDAARAFQRELFMTAMAATITEASRLLTDGEQATIDEIEGSIAYRLIELLTGDAPPKTKSDTHQHFFKMLRDRPSRFLAHVENQVPDYRKSTVASLRRSAK